MTHTNQTSTIKIDPRCRKGHGNYKMPTYSATGYIVPCSYADNQNLDEFSSLMKEHLKVSNVKDIERDILNSTEWKEFHNLLEADPDKAPSVCKFYCGSDWLPKKRIYNT